MRVALTGVAAGIALCVAGCATVPPPPQIVNSRTFERSSDAVWSDIVEYFASRNIVIKTIEKQSGIIYAERVNFSVEDLTMDPAMARCDALFSRQGEASAQINVFVRAVAPTKTSVTVNTTFSVHHPSLLSREWSTDPCYSTGYFEQHVLDWVSKRGAP